MSPFISGESIEAIAIGTGRPSFSKFLEMEMIRYGLPDGSIYEPKLFGCGTVSNYINNLDSYYYGDSTHMKNVPDPESQWHPGVKVYAGTRNLNDLKEASREHIKDIPLIPYTDLNIPHGNSSGGMAVSAACQRYDVVAIVGFDATDWKPFLSIEAMNQFIEDFTCLLYYWKDKGKKIVSLMEKSAFNDILIPYSDLQLSSNISDKL